MQQGNEVSTVSAPSPWAILVVRVAGACVAALGWRAFQDGTAEVFGALAMGAGIAVALWGNSTFEAGIDRLFSRRSQPKAQ